MAGAKLSETAVSWPVWPTNRVREAAPRDRSAQFVPWRLAYLAVTVFHGSDPGESALTWDAQASGRMLQSGL
jgi:hypothetical protein